MKPNWRQCIAMAALAGFAGSAFAQYIWLDDKGVKQYSDIAPPASVPKNRILKEPGKSRVNPSPAAAEDAGGSEKSASASATAKAPPLTTAEKNADFQKRRAEQADKEKQEAEKEKLAAEKAKNCEKAKAYYRALESGQRIAQTDKNGERAIMGDEQRNQEIREVKRQLDECKAS